MQTEKITRDQVEREHCLTRIKQFGSFFKDRIVNKRNQPTKNSYTRDSGLQSVIVSFHSRRQETLQTFLVKSIRSHSMYVNKYFH